MTSKMVSFRSLVLTLSGEDSQKGVCTVYSGSHHFSDKDIVFYCDLFGITQFEFELGTAFPFFNKA